jgi:hypothetical protein
VTYDTILDAQRWITTAGICDRLKCLPEPGSLSNQRSVTMLKLLKALKALDQAELDDSSNRSKAEHAQQRMNNN